MRAVIFFIAGLLIVSQASAGSLLPEGTAFSERNASDDLGLPSFSDGAENDALTFNSIGQVDSTQLFDIGGEPSATANGNIFQELQLDLSGAERPSKDGGKKPE